MPKLKPDLNAASRFSVWVVVFVVLLIGLTLLRESLPAIQKFGWRLPFASEWDPVAGEFGLFPFIYGTAVSSFLAVLIAVPFSIGIAIFLTELAPAWLRSPLAFLMELLAAIPSVIYGLWGIFYLAPWLREVVEPFFIKYFGLLPFFRGPPYGIGMLAAGIILAIMITPIISSITRDVLQAVPNHQREAALALGATRWEATRIAVLRYGQSGIVGAIFLGLGRALGETMAVTMVIGNRPEANLSLFAPAHSMASVIANEFAEASSNLHLSALASIGLTLFAITFLINAGARFLVWKVSGSVVGARVAPSTGKARGASPSTPLRGWKSSLIRNIINRLMSVSTLLACVIAIIPLFMILFFIVSKGIGSLNLNFFTELPHPVGETGGGMGNAIVGTLLLAGLACLVGVPIGILGGIRLAEPHKNRWNLIIRFATDILNGTPSIVIGIFAYTLLVKPMRHFSALAGGFALGILMIPTVIRTTEEMIKLVPQSLREGSLALGVSTSRTLIRIVLKTARAGILTGILLAIARIAGETAPLLFTALGNQYWSTNLKDPIAALPLQIFVYAISPFEEWQRQAWAGALVLISLVLTLNIGSRLFLKRRGFGR